MQKHAGKEYYIEKAIDTNGQVLIPEIVPGGLYYRTARGVQLNLEGVEDGIICRIRPPADTKVVQLALGQASSRLCDAIYSPARDCALVFRGAQLQIAAVQGGYMVVCEGPLKVTRMDDFMKVHREVPWFRPMDRTHFPAAPTGWCSWYYYYLGINQEEVVKNTDWLAENLQKFGCEWIQIDDGWQGKGTGLGSNRDWFATCVQDFPQGMEWCAGYIRSKGFRAGIWCIPFTYSNEEVFRKNPDMFILREDGTSVGEHAVIPEAHRGMPPEDQHFEWAGRYFIDPTSPRGEDFLRQLFTLMCREWGYEYVKIDAQAMMPEYYEKYRKQLYNPAMSGEMAYREGLQVIKDVMGPEAFLLNCGYAWDSVNLCEGIRTGGDVIPGEGWKGFQLAIDVTLRKLYLNSIAFYTDPDALCVRECVSLEEARLWATFVGITGQLLMMSDKMYELPPERVELLKRILPVAPIRPMELYALDEKHRPDIFVLKVDKSQVGQWDIAALFNWSETEERVIELTPARLGWQEKEWLCVDYWQGEVLHKGAGTVKIVLPPKTSRLLSCWKLENRPVFTGTNRHITQGGIDMEWLDWEEETLTLSGVSQVVGGDPYEIRIHVPANYQPEECALRTDGGLMKLMLHREQNESVRWKVKFKRI